ncbi:unnamed protein product, partial [Rotaria sp. Silwood2]
LTITMSHATRDPDNPPAYYYTLTEKQQHNWRKTAKKIKKNEDLQVKYPPFKSSSNINIIQVIIKYQHHSSHHQISTSFTSTINPPSIQ